jgi:hypothetical protein
MFLIEVSQLHFPFKIMFQLHLFHEGFFYAFCAGSDLKGRRGSNALPTDQGLTLCSDNAYGRFGTAVAILDFNRDAVMDIGK